MFPVMLCLDRVPCLVVGGGDVALRKVTGLVRDGALATVVAPEAVSGIRELAEAGSVTLESRPYRTGEAAGYRLVFAATDDRDVNRQVRDDATAGGVWVNVADDPELCTFHLPARVERGPLQISIASGGGAPFIVRRLREMLEKWFAPEWNEWARAAARFRDAVRSSSLGPEQRETVFDRFFAETVDREHLRVRAPGDAETASWLAGTNGPGESPQRRAFVSLVGAGPGNGGLLSLRGYRRLMHADAVVYDRLAAPAMPCDVPRRVELYPVGKVAGHHPVPQDEINALLVSLASQGKRVVRFKGGDPYVFGRGGEEALALRAAGIAFEVIPGITAGVAGPGWAGVPVTHRHVSSRVTLYTAHQAADGIPSSGEDVPSGGAGATTVGYMGVANLEAVVDGLLERGFAGSTPAMLIEQATTARQRSVRASLATLPEAAERSKIRPPALIVVGAAVALAEQLDWFSGLPLAGERLVLAAPAGTLGASLELAGAEVLVVSVPLTPAARVAIAALPVTGWLARNADEARSLGRDLLSADPEGVAAAWCFNEEAAGAARQCGWERARTLSTFAPEGVVQGIADRRTT
jgi:uroporphyrin-III C-methyltransferase/precorrin-2 dehydrogenase/sirohydrochlorin ferrochelatase